MAKKLSAAAEQALSVIAHIAMAKDMAKNVRGMEKFGDFYLKNIDAKDRAVYARFNDLCRQAYKDLARMMADDIKAGDGQ
jgi:catalase